MQKKQSSVPYFISEIGWAWRTTGAWLRLLMRDRRAAMNQLREGAQSEEFRNRARIWRTRAAFSYGRIRIGAPVLVGLATATYCSLTQHSVATALAYGVAVGVGTHLLVRALPFAMIAAAPLIILFAYRALLPGDLPSPPPKDAETTAQQSEEPHQGQAQATHTKASSEPDQTSAMPASHGTAERSESADSQEPSAETTASREESLLSRVLKSDGSVTLTTEEEFAIAGRWIEEVRAKHKELEQLAKQVSHGSILSTYVNHEALFELGLLDDLGLATGPSQFEGLTEQERIEEAMRKARRQGAEGRRRATQGSGLLEDDYVDPSNTKPTLRPGQLLLLDPNGSGRVVKTLHGLKRMRPASLTSSACHDIVTAYARATKDAEMMKRWIRLTNSPPNIAATLRQHGAERRVDLRRLEDQLLAREITDTSIQALARRHVALGEACKEHRDYISLQVSIARLVRQTLSAAHSTLRANAKAEEARRQEARREAPTHPYGRDEPPTGTPMTIDQRRRELHRLIMQAVPTQEIGR